MMGGPDCIGKSARELVFQGSHPSSALMLAGLLQGIDTAVSGTDTIPVGAATGTDTAAGENRAL